MKAIVIGSGTIGSAVRKALEEKGHEVVSVGRKSGDYQADISHPESLKALFSRIGSFDAVADAAGDVSFGALEESTDEQWANSIKFKGMGQINLVLTCINQRTWFLDRMEIPQPSSTQTAQPSGCTL